ncbi:MAG TPA: hypothetical protein VHJ20_06355 [Polyangia bacterium]|nr:hypothetical protein [Polyangia bacterium]
MRFAVVTVIGVGVALTVAACGSSSKAPPSDGSVKDAPATSDARDVPAETPADANADVAVDAADGKPAAVCSDAGAKLNQGQACGCDADCTTNHCVDGVCCNSACGETCKTCAAKGSVGTCTSRVAGTMPRDEGGCVASDQASCGFDGTCDGAGACRRWVSGTVCQSGTCDGEAIVDELACDGLGHCKPGPTTICAPFSCDATKGACFEACTQSSQCAPGQQCVNGSCGKKMKGAKCGANDDCASGFCADGVCCNVSCQGACVSCTLSGRTGTCWPVEPGLPDPRGVCKDTGATSCGTTGICDGFGSCEKYAAETVCIPPSCTGTRRNTPGTCDGKGTCRAQGVQNCSPFLCTAGACTQRCATDDDCEAGHACINNQCGKINLGQPCSSNDACLSGQCVEGVCCDSACTGACQSCALTSNMGHCTAIAEGAVDPKGLCADEGAATCGKNGKCDGNGGCQKYKVGTVCAPESCVANVYTPPSTCSATAQCTPPDSLPCAPFTCNGNACFNACRTSQDCVMPNSCLNNLCGKKNIGASCSGADECGSGFCAQGVCCDQACAGSCTSCALPGSLGTCTNVPNDAPDPADLCVDQGAASCGTNGLCQGGVCQAYKQGTACKDATCPATTTTFTAGSTCDGAGSCQTPAARSCFPFLCGAAACQVTCTSNADCASPAVCIGGSCGLKDVGSTCADGMECRSGFCAQGVCCGSACSGVCASCSLPGALGKCQAVPSGGNDPMGRCADQGAASCGTDGKCDGGGACRLYAASTPCAAASCPAGGAVLTLGRVCDGAGTCKPATAQACAPYQCNGLTACRAACTVDADCAAPNICDPQTNLCGNKKRLGQTCATTNDCLTGSTCVDGVCCSSAACGLCQSCAVPGFAGSCTNLASGAPALHAQCAANPPCGNTGNCNGAGACEQAGAGVACGAAGCAGSTFTPVSHCTGTGACATPTTSSCSPYACGATTCLATCTGDGDCVAPFTCQGGGASKSCALKANGLACTTGGQCISGHCTDGVCCGSASCAGCQACNVGVGASAGTCQPVAAGTAAPTTFCSDQGAATCGTNGKCDGSGGCQKYADGTSCAAATCPAGATTLKKAGTCGGGTCNVPTASCAPFVCNGAAACTTSCALDTDCVAGAYCTAGEICQLKAAAGATCGGDHECATGHCTDGVCCGSASCGSCQACNLGTGANAGTCLPLAAGAPDPKAVCTDGGAAACGTNGKCDGAGGCQKYADGTTCATATCPAGTTTLKKAGTCSGGTCSVPTQACGAFFCNGGTGAGAGCASTCNVDGDCTPGNFCTGTGGTCTAKGAAGSVCTTDHQCGTGHCTDGVCCGSASCGSCQACNVGTGANAGTCLPLAAGTVDPKGMCSDGGAAACGTNGKCDGAGGCQKYGDGTACATATCPAGTTTLKKAGACSGGTCSVPTQACGAFYCNGGTGAGAACASSCNVDGDCTPGNYCTGTGGTCTAKGAPGAVCASDHQCGTGHCTDGVCCASAACGSCQACNVGASAGACAPVGAGTPDPKGVCADLGAAACGTNGLCDGAGACQKYADGTTCSSASCPAGSTTLTSAGACSAGVCATTTSSCGAYKCDGAMSCRGTCATDGDCASTAYCAGLPFGACTLKVALGQACTADDQCTSDHCTDGVCCGSASCGACRACNLTGSRGTCDVVAAGAADPHGGCSDQGAASCGTTGVCDGAGACAKYADGTSCADASCPAGSATKSLATTCAAGACTVTTQSCGLYACNGTDDCNSKCNNDGDCASGAYCTGTNGSCVGLVPQAMACTSDHQCATGNCVDGFCCGSPGCNGCQSCGVPGKEGTCANVAAGTPSNGFCPDDGAASCARDSKCDGAGGCEKYVSGTVCLAASCTPTTTMLTTASTCDGSGTCVAGTAGDCGAYLCLADGTGCASSCAGDGDCSAGNSCQPDSRCGP